ncbi:aryl-sulfate sulfotransferase [Halobacillus sp. K22]|uniref:aryl-sulfate sulfotransferase n=1 Tax=Halobacillus sp. K22 TaxID=3457431 RepID=UPI003FCCF5E6
MKKWMIGLMALLVVAGGGIGYYYYSAQESATDGGGKRLIYSDDSLMEAQNAGNDTVDETYKQRSYTLKDPLVIQDPYNRTPLTALVKFETDQPAELSMTIEGKDKETTIQHTWPDYQTSHALDLLGLYPGTANKVELTARFKDGSEKTKMLTIQTEPLPDDFLNIEVEKSDRQRMENGLTFMSPSEEYPFAVDSMGDVRWYSTQVNSHVLQRLDNGKFLYVTKEQDQYNQLVEMDMMGRVSYSSVVEISNYSGWGVIHHDAVKLPSENFLMTVHDASGDYIEDSMVEVDGKTGEKVNEFNFRSIFPEEIYEDYDGPAADEGDWFHQNALWYDEKRDDYLVSSRHQSLIMNMDYPSGDISWILAENENWPEDFDPPLLEPVGEDFKFPGGPHAVMPLPDQDNNEATRDILIFDNNIAITRGNEELSEEFSRAVQYRINEEEMTVKEVWEYGRERGKSFYSNIVSDANYLPGTGNRLITSGYTQAESEDMRQSQIVEVTGEKDPEVVFEVNVGSFEKGSHRQVYRSERLPLYPAAE